jgi:hypothetical protein
MKRIDINKEVLSKYTDEQLKQWAVDNQLTEAELKEIKKQLKPQKAEKPSE